MHWHPLTLHEHEHLAALGIGAGLFEFFRNTLVPNCSDFSIDHASGWFARSERRICNADLIGHLVGDFVLEVRCRRDPATKHYFTDRFTIALDDGPDLWSRADRTIKAFRAPVLFLSGNSGGLHARYFLEETVDLFTLLDPRTGDGIVPRLLHEAGLELSPGAVELYPQGSCIAVSSGKALPLPFGKASRLLDPFDRMPMARGGPVADLRLFRRLLDDEKIEPLSVSELTERAGARCVAASVSPDRD